jgi:hypothetical protein
MTIKSARNGAVLLVAAATLLTAAITTGSLAANPADPTQAPIPVVDLDHGSKVVVVTLDFTGQNAATMTAAKVVRGRSHGHIADPSLLRVQLLDHGNALIDSFGAYNPLYAFVEGDSVGSEGLKEMSTARGTFSLPFSPNLRTFRLLNPERGGTVGQYDLEPAIGQFCKDNPTDADCRTDLRVTLGDAPDPAVAGMPLTLTARITNDGPNPAHWPAVTFDLPAGFGTGTLPEGCVALSSGARCTFGVLPPAATRVVALPVLIAADLVHLNGSPVTAISTATADNGAAADTDPSDNSATESTLVLARADLSTGPPSVSAATDMVIGQTEQAEVSGVASSDGPSSPMDAVVTRTVTSSGGLTVTPATQELPVSAVEKGIPRAVDSQLQVTCTQPGLQTYTVTDAIRPSRPDDADPEPGNNSASRTVSVECVVPVALAIKPDNNPNPATRHLAMAVLTTEAGEYDLPLAFDATRIDPLSVRFGPAEVVFSKSGGTPESHARGHVEDAAERESGVRDGDLDLVLHHLGAGSGLTTTSTEGCVRGTFSGPDGQAWSFFGCDLLRTR